MEKDCIKCVSRDNCIRYNVNYNSKYCQIHKKQIENDKEKKCE